MKCTSEEWDHCRVEKMGCPGCYYDDSKLEEAKNNLTKLVELRKNKCGEIKFDTCICGTKDLETVLQALPENSWRVNNMNIKKALDRTQDLIRTCEYGIENHPQDKELFSTDKTALETLVAEVKNLIKENENLKSYLAKQCLINDYIKYKRKVENKNGN